jgi:hypothetical protein
MKEQLAGGLMHNDNLKEEAPTSAQLRHGIATGKSRDKISNIDPAAAPLGTDDEAAGNAPSQDEIRKAAQQELRGDAVPPQPTEPLPVIVMIAAAALLAIGVWVGVNIPV